MRVKSTTIGRRLACAIGASALILSGAGFAAPAMAQDEPVADVAAAMGNIDFNQTGSITIHKHQHQNGTEVLGDPKTGDYEGANPSEGIADVQFKIYKIKNIDLQKAEDWDTLNGLKAEEVAEDTANLELVDTVVTGADGQIKTKDLPLGAYLVVEGDAPANVVDKAAPFIVTLPYPNTTEEKNGAANQENPKATDEWLYDVHVFPKNGVFSLKKTVESQPEHGLNVGSVVKFPVTATIPSLAKDDVFKYFQIVDPMDPRFDPASVGIDEDYGVTLGGEKLDASDYTVGVQGHQVVVSFTSQGLGKLKNAPGQDVVVKFTGKLKSLADESRPDLFGTILNKAYVYQDFENNPGESTPPSTPPATTPVTTPPSTPPTEPPTTTPPGETPLVKQFWGDLRIQKVDKGDGKTGLEGAEFKVYPAANPYPADNGACSAEIAEGAKPVQKSGVGEGDDLVVASDKDGLVKFEGLFVSDDQNDPKSAPFRCYVLVETKAPTGFVTPNEENNKYPVQVKIGQTAVEEYDAKVENAKRDTPDLPLTGGKGVIMLMALGGILLVVAIGAGVVFIRRVRA